MTTGGLDMRDLPAELAEDIAGPALNPFFALHVDLPDPVFAFSGRGTITIDGQDYIGWEGIASLDVIGESTDGSAKGIKATLMRIPAEFRDDIADQAVRGCLFEVYLGTIEDDFKTLRGWKRWWKGTLQGYDVRDEGDSLTVTISGEGRSIDQRRPAIKRFTDEYQQRKYAGDRIFEYAASMVEVPVLWAKAKQDAL